MTSVEQLIALRSREAMTDLHQQDAAAFGRAFNELWERFALETQEGFEVPQWSAEAWIPGAALLRVVAWVVTDWTTLRDLCLAVESDEEAGYFLHFYMGSDLADDKVIRDFVAKVKDERVLALNQARLEPAVWRQGVYWLGRTAPDQIRLRDLLPPPDLTERSTLRALIGAAVDSGRLSEADFLEVLSMFPGDRYLESRLT